MREILEQLDRLRVQVEARCACDALAIEGLRAMCKEREEHARELATENFELRKQLAKAQDELESALAHANQADVRLKSWYGQDEK